MSMNPVSMLRIIPADIPAPAAPEASEDSEFLDTLKDAMGQVDRLQGQAEQQVSALLEGNGLDVHSALIAVEKADLSFQLMMQVRNKIVQAYQEVSRMQF